MLRIKPRKYVTIEIFDDWNRANSYAKALLKNDAEKEKLRKEHNVQDKKLRLTVRG